MNETINNYIEFESDELALERNRLHAIERLNIFIPQQDVLADKDKESQTKEENPSNLGLRTWQIDFFKRYLDALTNGLPDDIGRQPITDGFVKVPPGAGKTRAFIEFVNATDLKTLIVVPTQILVDQTYESLRSLSSKPAGRRDARSKDIEEEVLITTYDSLVRDVANHLLNPTDFGILILDEVHRSLSKKRMDTVALFSRALKLGFTATDRFGENKQVKSLLRNKIYEKTIPEAVEEEIISGFKIIAIETQIDLSSIKLNVDGEYDEKELEKAINNESRNKAAVEVYKNLYLGKKGIAYCAGVQHAIDLAEIFNAQGITARACYGRLPKSEKNKILTDFKNGTINILTGDKLFIEGFDDPSVEVGFMLKPSNSIVDVEQRAGRILRISESKMFASIVEFFDIGINQTRSLSFADIVGTPYLVTTKFSQFLNRRRGVNTITSYDKQINIPEFHVITRVHEVMQFLSKRSSYESDIPREWSNASQLKNILSASRETIVKKVKELKDELPEDFISLNISNGFSGSRVAEFYSPELIDLIMQKLGVRELAPEDWFTSNKLVNNFDFGTKNPESINNIAQTILATIPEEQRTLYCKIYRTGNKLVEHYSPIMIDMILHRTLCLREEFEEETEEFYKRWRNTGEIKEYFLADASRVRDEIGKIRDELQNPENEIQTFGIAVYCSPRISKLLKDRLKGREKAAEEWKSFKKLGSLYNSNATSIEKIARKIVEESDDLSLAEDLKFMRTISGSRDAFHVSPRLIERIEKYFARIRAPEGWITRRLAVERYKMGIPVLQQQINKILNTLDPDERENHIKVTERGTFYSPFLANELSKIHGNKTA